MDSKKGNKNPDSVTCLLAGIPAREEFEGTAALRHAIALATRPAFELALYVFPPAVESPTQLTSASALDWVERETTRSAQLSLTTLQNARRLVAEAGVELVADYASVPSRDPVPFLNVTRVNDVTVLDAADTVHGLARNAIEDALFDSGRPLLVVPRQGALPPCRRIMIAWDGSRSSARVIKDALPFLKLSESVVALTVTGEKDPSSIAPGANLQNYLGRHGIDCELATLPKRTGDTAELIRAFSIGEGIDMLIMGAFVHSRLREAILGGVTRSFLDDCPWPLLIEH